MQCNRAADNMVMYVVSAGGAPRDIAQRRWHCNVVQTVAAVSPFWHPLPAVTVRIPLDAVLLTLQWINEFVAQTRSDVLKHIDDEEVLPNSRGMHGVACDDVLAPEDEVAVKGNTGADTAALTITLIEKPNRA
jgi:hypothetical protein